MKLSYSEPEAIPYEEAAIRHLIKHDFISAAQEFGKAISVTKSPERQMHYVQMIRDALERMDL